MKMKKQKPGTWATRELLESKAYLALRGVAPQILMLFLLKRRFETTRDRKGAKSYTCTNSDNIRFTYVEAEKAYGISKPRFARALDELLGKGFLELKHHGGICQHDENIFGLSENWRIWLPGTVFEKRQREFVTRGFCKPKKKSTYEGVPMHSNEIVPLKQKAQQRNRTLKKKSSEGKTQGIIGDKIPPSTYLVSN